MPEHIQRFAQLLNTIENENIHDRRAGIVTDKILRIFDKSDDIPGDIEALLHTQFAAVERQLLRCRSASVSFATRRTKPQNGCGRAHAMIA
jgi:hypothetical protein